MKNNIKKGKPKMGIRGDIILGIVYIIFLALLISNMACVVIVDLPQHEIEELKKDASERGVIKFKPKDADTSATIAVDSSRLLIPLSKSDSLKRVINEMITEPDTLKFKEPKAVDFSFYVDTMNYEDSLYSKMRQVREEAKKFFIEDIQERYPNRKINYKDITQKTYKNRKIIVTNFNTEKYSIPTAYYISEYKPSHPAGNGSYKYVVTFVYDLIAYR